MNAITRLILRHVVSGNVELTPRLLDVLKELDQDQSGGTAPKYSTKASDNSREQFKAKRPTEKIT